MKGNFHVRCEVGENWMLKAGCYLSLFLNIISLKDPKQAEALNEVFNPKVMIIDKNDGLFNRRMNLIKDEIIGLSHFCS